MIHEKRRILRGSHPVWLILVSLFLGIVSLTLSGFWSTGIPPRQSRFDGGIHHGVVSQPTCPGDSNLDQNRNVSDAVLIVRHLLGKTALEGDAARNADMNEDGVINVQDVVTLLRHTTGQNSLTECGGFIPNSSPTVVSRTPGSGPPGTLLTLRGWNLGDDSQDSFVVFHSLEGAFQAQIVQGDSESVSVLVPEVGLDTYVVTVSTRGLTSSGAQFEVNEAAPNLQLNPTYLEVYLPPGSGEGRMIIGGGTPPYKILPVPEHQQGRAELVLNGSVIKVKSLLEESEWPFEVDVIVQDSSEWQTEVSGRADFYPLRGDLYEPEVSVSPHTLLEGTAPGWTIRSHFTGSQIVTEKLEITIAGAEVNLSDLFQGRIIGIGQIISGWGSGFEDLQLMEVTADPENGKAPFRVLSLEDERVTVVAEGVISQGSSRLSIRNLLVLPETMNPGTFDAEWILTDGILGLPAGVQSLGVKSEFTSGSVHQGKDLPFRHQVKQELQTVGLDGNAPRLERLLPMNGEIGRRVHLLGSRFAPDAAGNDVTFAGSAGTRVAAPVVAVENGELVVEVPEDAVSGPVQVSVAGVESNEFSFWVLFHAQAEILLPQMQAGVASGFQLKVRQPPALDADWNPTAFADELRMDSIRVEITGGQWDFVSQAQKDVIGTAEFTNLRTGTKEYTLAIMFGGAEEGETDRSVLVVDYQHRWKPGRVPILLMYAWEQDGAVLLEIDLWNSYGRGFGPGYDWDLSFTSPIYQSAVAGVPEAVAATKSIPWNVIADTELIVRTAGGRQ